MTLQTANRTFDYLQNKNNQANPLVYVTYEKMQESKIELGAIFGYAQNKTRNKLVWKPCIKNYAFIQKPPNEKIQLVPVYSA